MILSKQERHLLETLESCEGPTPVGWLKPKYRALVPRLRELGLLRKRDPKWAHLTKLGRATADSSGVRALGDKS